jgi:hypothetical protein
MNTISLENSTLRLEFNRATGALTGLTAVQTGWKIFDRPSLGLSFRLLAPLSEEKRNNPVYGEKQALTSVAVAPDNRCAVFTWDGVTSELGGALAIKLTLEVKLTERQALYAMTIENHSAHTVENVYCPYLGDIQHPRDEAWFKTFLCGYASPQEWSLWPTYANLRGYYGVDYPVQIAPGAPMAPFILLRGERQGLYAGVCAPSPEQVAWQTELRPGYGSSIDARLPEELKISGTDVATRFAAVHVPYIAPGETRTLTPIALEAFQGGWQAGADIYKQWRRAWMKLPQLPGWATEPHAWQQIHINSPEDELRMRFTDLPQIGKDCARHGVKAIQLVGWNDGGQDQGNPSHDPDPRLGTFQELKDAIAKIQALGVKVIFFAKFTWADRATEWFRKDLIRQAIKDPYGDCYVYSGYQYQTVTQLLDINTKRMIPMCFLSKEYLCICEQEFRKMLELGADGILFDECQHHSPTLHCFDTGHGHRYGAPTYANDCKLIQNFNQLSQPVNPDFFYAGEACYDWEMEAYQLAYFRTESKTHIPIARYLLPDAQYMTAVTGFNDRNMINQCLLYRYIISYEPYNFKGRLDDYPLTLEYGKQMDALRTDLRAYFWDGEFRHEVGARVTVGGQPHHPYAVFVNRVDGKSGIVIANYNEKQALTVHAELESGQPLSRYHLVDDVAWYSTENGIVLPPCSAAAVIE